MSTRLHATDTWELSEPTGDDKHYVIGRWFIVPDSKDDAHHEYEPLINVWDTETAQFTAKALNSYPALLEALERMTGYADSIAPVLEGEGGNTEAAYLNDMAAARQAIKEATE